MVDEVLAQLSRRFDSMYASAGRPSIPPEKLLRAQLLQMLYSIRSERLLMEEIGFGWLKTIALLRKVRHRGIWKVDWVFNFACAAYNLARMRNLSHAVVQSG
jgi:hypothetical protein